METKVEFSAFFRRIAGYSMTSWINFITGIASVVLMTRLFAPDVIGAYTLFNTATDLLMIFCCMGFDNALIRFFYAPPHDESHQALFKRCVGASLLCYFIVALVILMGFSHTLSALLFKKDDILLIVFLLLNVFSLLLMSRYLLLLFRMKNQIASYTVLQLSINFFSKIFVLASALLSSTIESVLLFNTVGMGILLLIYLVLQRKAFSARVDLFARKKYDEIFRFAVSSWPMGVLQRMNLFLVPFLIGQYLDNYKLGIYSSTLFFCTAFTVLFNGFTTYWSPFMYKNYTEKQIFIIKVHDYVSFLLIALEVLLLISQKFTFLFIGEMYRYGTSIFLLVLLEPIYLLLAETTCYGIGIQKKNKEASLIFFLGVLMNGVFLWIGMQFFDLVGAAYAVAATAFIKFCLMTWRGQTYYKSIESKGRTILSAVIMLALAVMNSLFFSQMMLNTIFAVMMLLLAICLYKGILLEAVAGGRRILSKKFDTK